MSPKGPTLQIQTNHSDTINPEAKGRVTRKEVARGGSPLSAPTASFSCKVPGAQEHFRSQCFCFQVGVPPGTWPFCLSTLTFLLLTTNSPTIYKLPLSRVTYPEANRIFYLTVKSGEEEKSSSGD